MSQSKLSKRHKYIGGMKIKKKKFGSGVSLLYTFFLQAFYNVEMSELKC